MPAAVKVTGLEPLAATGKGENCGTLCDGHAPLSWQPLAPPLSVHCSAPRSPTPSMSLPVTVMAILPSCGVTVSVVDCVVTGTAQVSVYVSVPAAFGCTTSEAVTGFMPVNWSFALVSLPLLLALHASPGLMVHDSVADCPCVMELGETLMTGGSGAVTVRLTVTGVLGAGQVRV